MKEPKSVYLQWATEGYRTAQENPRWPWKKIAKHIGYPNESHTLCVLVHRYRIKEGWPPLVCRLRERGAEAYRFRHQGMSWKQVGEALGNVTGGAALRMAVDYALKHNLDIYRGKPGRPAKVKNGSAS